MANTLPDHALPVEQELRTYYRELPRLLSEGNENRYALIRGGEPIRLFDTEDESVAAGREMFGPDGFLSQRVRRLDLVSLAPYFPAVAGAGSRGIEVPRMPVIPLHKGSGQTPEQMRRRLANFETEYRTYVARVPAILATQAPDSYAVIQGEDFTAWDTRMDAVQYGVLKFGAAPFLVHQISASQVEVLLSIFPEFRDFEGNAPPCPPSATASDPTGASSASVSA